MEQSKNTQNYLVFARKYRPMTFDDVLGQDHVTRALRNAIEMERVAHAYLFSGPRGVGKTTMARILAKALNCEKGPTASPCGKCSNCVEIAEGRSLDVLEIDGASNNKVENIRELNETVLFGAASSRYKIYIIDEVHMLTESAFNALLKTLEEPPPHVKFIFATTEAHEVIGTILSRCQRYDFRQIPADSIVASLRKICAAEGIDAEDGALFAIAVYARGGLRDAQSTLDQMAAFKRQKITYNDVVETLGLIHSGAVLDVCSAVVSGDVKTLLCASTSVFDLGKPPSQFINDLIEAARNLVTVKYGAGSKDYELLLGGRFREFKQIAESLSHEQLVGMIDILLDASSAIRHSPSTRAEMDAAFVKLGFLVKKNYRPKEHETTPLIEESGQVVTAPACGAEPVQVQAPSVNNSPEQKPERDEAGRADISAQAQACSAQEKTPDAEQDHSPLKEKLLKALPPQEIRLKAHLANASVARRSDGSYVILFGKEMAYHREEVTRAEVMTKIKEALKLLNPQEKQCEVFVEEGGASRPHDAPHSARQQASFSAAGQASFDKTKYISNPVVKALVETFDGEVESIKPKQLQARTGVSK